MPLSRWFWRSYLRAAVIPLLVIELTFLLVYWASTQITFDRNVTAISEISRDELARSALNQADTIDQTLDGVSSLTRLFATESARVLGGPVPTVPSVERDRYGKTLTGVVYTRPDTQGPAAFFSGAVPVGPDQMDTVWRSTALDPIMEAVTASHPLVTQVYLNTRESYNRIYPPVDVLATFDAGMVIPDFNFYYEADARHNPGRRAVWTDAYVDPAGSGWMVSSIAPVYVNDVLEGVVGVDLTIKTIVDRILNLSLPWDGYAMLIGRDGTILALPERGEADFGLTELMDHSYASAIQGDTFKPEVFNVFKRGDATALARAVSSADPAVFRLDLDRSLLAAVAPVAGPGWSLVVLTPEDQILGHARDLREELRFVGAAMIVILLVFYAGFFAFLYVRSRQMSRRVAAPLHALEAAIERIGARDYDQSVSHTEVAELNTLVDGIMTMARRLGEADRLQTEAKTHMQESLKREQALNERQRQFINVVSHEFRTPLAIIDGSARALERRSTSMSLEDVTNRAGRLRVAVRRLCDVVDSGLAFARIEQDVPDRWAAFAPDDLIQTVIDEQRDAFPDRTVAVSVEALPAMWGDAAGTKVAISALLNNALRYSPADTTVFIDATCADGALTISVRDQGGGIPAEDLPRVTEQFYRGSNSLNTHGAGVGLYIADVCARLHGGSLIIDSRPGTGATCILTLPFGAPASGR